MKNKVSRSTVNALFCRACHSAQITKVDAFFMCAMCGYEWVEEGNKIALEHYYNAEDTGLMVQNILESGEDSILRNYHKIALSEIKKYTHSTLLSICDIGCGIGVFLRKAKENGHSIYGFDINKAQVKIAKNKYHLVDVDSAETLEQYCQKKKLPPSFFDVITMFEVIEHVPDVNQFLKEIRAYLKPGGYLIFSTPNKNRLPIHETWDNPPIHLSKFTRLSLRFFLKSHGFVMRKWLSFSELGYYSNNFIHKLSITQILVKVMLKSTSQMSQHSAYQSVSLITKLKQLCSKILDLPLYVVLHFLPNNGHTMITIAQKI